MSNDLNTPIGTQRLIEETGQSQSLVFGKNSGSRVAHSNDLKDEERRDRKYTAGESAFVSDRLGIDPMQLQIAGGSF